MIVAMRVAAGRACGRWRWGAGGLRPVALGGPAAGGGWAGLRPVALGAGGLRSPQGWRPAGTGRAGCD